MASSRLSSSGPDAMDVAQAMKEVEQYHNVGIILAMSPDGLSGFSHLKVSAVATLKIPTGSGLKRSVSRWRIFPSNDAKTLEGLLFRLVYELDKDCAAMWSQNQLNI